MRRPLVVGNWKMNGTRSSVDELLTALLAGIDSVPVAEVAVCPPYIFLDQTFDQLSGSKIVYGAQNVYQADEGAYTGEISPRMLREFGCTYVIVGHSERRHLMGETDGQVAEKFLFAGQNNLIPILCVGETKEQRELDHTLDVLRRQLAPILNNKETQEILANAVIAYEPVWAIGTGLTATPEEAQEVHYFIRKELANTNKNLAEKVRILYGGSVKQNNAGALFSMPDIDGGLIGGASLNAVEFLEIAKLCL